MSIELGLLTRRLLVVLLLLPAAVRAETKEFSVTDFAQIAGKWEGFIFVKQSGTTFANTLTITMSGTWEAPRRASCGTLSLVDGKVRSQQLLLMNKPVPLSKGSIGTWTFFENEGELSLKAERDDLSVTGQYTKKLSPRLSEARADTVNPQLLIGEWQGTVAWNPGPNFTTPYVLTVTGVTGQRVHGRMEWLARGDMKAANFPFVGTVDGNVLTIRNPELAFDLTILGDRIRGLALLGPSIFIIDVRKTSSVSGLAKCQ